MFRINEIIKEFSDRKFDVILEDLCSHDNKIPSCTRESKCLNVVAAVFLIAFDMMILHGAVAAKARKLRNKFWSH